MYSEFDLDKSKKAFDPSKINPSFYGKYIIIPKRATPDPRLNKNPVLCLMLLTLCSLAAGQLER